MQVETREISTLVPDPANARRHGTRNLDAIKASLQSFGQQRPILIDEKGVVRAGNGTLAAAKALGWTTIEVVVSSLLTETELAAYAIADNRTAELAEWDGEAAGVALIEAGFEIRNQIIWRKPHFPISRGHYHYQHEPCWYAVRKGHRANWIGDRKQSSVWELKLDDRSGSRHSTQKPVECMSRPMRNHKATHVLDPFVGSGTSIIAAEQVGMACLAMELSEEYASDAVRRWEQFVGEKAVLLSAMDVVANHGETGP